MTAWLRRHAIDISPLRHGAYRRLFMGNAVSSIGIQFTAVAVPVQMYRLTHSSTWVGLLGFASLVPLVAVALFGGAVADVIDRRKLLLASSALMWAVTIALAIQYGLGNAHAGVLLALVAVQAAAFGVATPTRGAIIPRLVPTAEVPAANTLNFTTFSAGAVVGPLLAGVVLAIFPLGTAYAIDAVLFTVVMWAALRLPALPPLQANLEAARGAWAQFAARSADVVYGLKFIGNSPVLLLSFVIDIFAMALALPRALFPEVAEERFGGPGAVGWLYASIAIGSLLAGLTSGWIGRVRRQGLALICSVVAWGVAVALAGMTDHLWLAVLFLAAGGAADLVSSVYRQTILQVYAPDELRGRMQGVFTAVVAGGPRLGDLRSGLGAHFFGVTGSWVGGGIAAALGAIGLGAAFPALRRYQGGPKIDALAGPARPAESGPAVAAESRAEADN
jgi:MFS family permease